ncbi:Threonine/homoserine/homoserine lactone efflux protein [Roseivivax halotolerans]|uniref:Threonine/homoserine/homoserine lactone efflux protein n=1 Tax=Roseivivax halotolerans TaxID=93684 RepID=A0A1I6ABK1_9RHOB|nr:LysE family translocator [Roseivivax halotolerans]SFQ66000.1 Threonine/homoserine/homoserine lactone efflux protein [Roseivivax halotolerans]
MNLAFLTALLGFAFVATATPGPNNLMLMASGANFGFRRTLTHMLGIAGGVTVMALLVGVGLMALFDAVPALNLVLKVASVGYLLWLAFKIATAAPVEERDADSRPMTFLQAAMFQWVNPKAWAMCLSAITLYAPDRSLLSVAIVAGAFALVCFPAISVWAWLGTVVRKWLSNATRLRVFNITMAALLVASLYPVLGLGT